MVLLEVIALAMKLENRVLLRSAPRFSSVRACHSWNSVTLKFLVDVVSESSLEVISMAKKSRRSLSLRLGSIVSTTRLSLA